MTSKTVYRRVSRIAIGAACAFAAIACAGTASAQMVVLAPPAPMYEAAPPPDAGAAWQPGYWAWTHGQYVWVPGRRIVREAVVPEPVIERPAPIEQAPVRQVMRISADALFPFDRGDVADLLPGGRADIHEIAARLRDSHFRRIEVRGYTDRLGSASYNLELSKRRANAVKAQLITEGIPDDRIDAVGLGEQDPISHCAAGQQQGDLVSCLQPDRRVEIVTYASPDQERAPRPYAGGQGNPAYNGANNGYRAPSE
jgi:OOP family OmpA-OmpF porin